MGGARGRIPRTAIALRADTHTSSVVEVEQRPDSGSARARTTDQLELGKRTTTSEHMSDTLVGTLLGLGAVLVAAGAFYNRVRNVTVGGNTIELGGPSEAQAIADVITDRLADELRAEGRGAVPVDNVIELASRAAEESARVQQQVVQARVEASGAEAQPDTLEHVYETRKFRVGSSMSRELIEQIAAKELQRDGDDQEPG
jgi:hypothetical protein